MLTLPDICDKLERMDEVTVLELLDIHSADIVAKFHDAIEERADYLEELMIIKMNKGNNELNYPAYVLK
jgi:hypothetical protein